MLFCLHSPRYVPAVALRHTIDGDIQKGHAQPNAEVVYADTLDVDDKRIFNDDTQQGIKGG